MMNYVQQREAELKRQFQIEMWWAQMSNMWYRLAEIHDIKRNLDVWQEAFNKVRAEYIRKGRKPGYSPGKKAA
jgi:hypothetical protein